MLSSTILDDNADILNELTVEHTRAASFLPFSAAQLQDTFSDDELKIVTQIVRQMHGAASDNKRSALLIENIGAFAAPLVKLLKLARVIA